MKKVIIALIVTSFLFTGMLRQFRDPFSDKNVNSSMNPGMMSSSHPMSLEKCVQTCLMNGHLTIIQIVFFSPKIVKKSIAFLALIDIFLLVAIFIKSFFKKSPRKKRLQKAFTGIENLVLKE